MRARILLAFVAMILVACGASPYFRPQAFVPPLRHYRVRYLDAQTHAVLGPEWRILNFDDGRIPDAAGWMTYRRIDEGAGPRRLRLPVFDVFAQHEDRSAIFVMTVPVGPAMAARDLRVVAHDHLDALIGRTLSRLHGGRRSRTDRVVASSVLEERPAEIGGAPAYLMTIERGDGAGGGTGNLLSVAVIRPPRRWRSSGLADVEHGAAMVLLVGLESRADRHAAHRVELDRFLDRLDVRPAE